MSGNIDFGVWELPIHLKSLRELGGFSVTKETERLGGGSFGDVYGWTLPAKTSGVRRWPEVKVAVKVLKTNQTGKELHKWQVNLVNEQETMKIQHPALLQAIYCAWLPYPMIVSLRAKTSLDKVLIDAEKGTPDAKWELVNKLIVIFGIAAGLCKLHKDGIIHRDFKPSNILLDDNFYPHIADFGLSRPLPGPLTERYEMTRTGTEIFYAPELIRGETYTAGVDVYAFAIVMYCILAQETPFRDIVTKIESRKITREEGVMQIWRRVDAGDRPQMGDDVNENLKGIVEKCWDNDPNQRMTMREVVDALYQMDIQELLDGDYNEEFDEYREYVYRRT